MDKLIDELIIHAKELGMLEDKYKYHVFCNSPIEARLAVLNYQIYEIQKQILEAAS